VKGRRKLDSAHHFWKRADDDRQNYY